MSSALAGLQIMKATAFIALFSATIGMTHSCACRDETTHKVRRGGYVQDYGSPLAKCDRGERTW
jgi:hypothetical protein